MAGVAAGGEKLPGAVLVDLEADRVAVGQLAGVPVDDEERGFGLQRELKTWPLRGLSAGVRRRSRLGRREAIAPTVDGD